MDLVIVYLVIVNFVNFATAQLAAEDLCMHKETGTQGICKYAAECEEAIQIIIRGLQPQLCGFDGLQSIVCCPAKPGELNVKEEEKQKVKVEEEKKEIVVEKEKVNEKGKDEGKDEGKNKDEKKKEVNGTVEDNKTTTRIVGQISKEKCKEYTKYIWEEESSPILIASGGDVIRRIGCPFNATELIVGGTPASRREFPHMVLVGFDSGNGDIKWACGGSLISEQFVLTAAHCLFTQIGEAKYAKMGIVDIDDEQHVQDFKIIDKIRHPSYDPPKREYDAALLKLDRKAKLNTYVRPACLYSENHTPESKAIASGWGKTADWGEESKNLLKVVLNFYGPDDCNKYFKLDRRLKAGIDDNLIICAGSPEENKDTCQGDSGGPLQIYNKEVTKTNCMYDIVGIVSFGTVCAFRPDVPAIYTRVSYFVDWIEDIVWSSS